MATTADFKNGLCFRHNTDLVTIVEFLHVKPGKGPAFVRTRLKSLESGKTYDHTFNSGVKIDTVRVERSNYQFLYKEGDMYHFMQNDTYEQITVEEKFINAPQFLKEGQEVEVMTLADEERVLSVDLKPHVELEITYTEPGIKGDTVSNTLKAATVETGAEVRVPLFINQGDCIKIDTRSGDYVERVKK
jgi:elongation factor P